MKEDSVIIRCGQCGVKNRVPRNRVEEHPRCGKCGETLHIHATGGKPVNITDASFHQEVVSWPGVVLVDCWAPWCGPCRMVAPILDELAAAYRGRVKVTKLNVDENPVTASQYAITSIPTMLFFKNGTKANQVVGAVPKGEIERYLKAML